MVAFEMWPLWILVVPFYILTNVAAKCMDGAFTFSIFGNKTAMGNWAVSYDLHQSFCDIKDNWRFDILQDGNSSGKIRLKGSFREKIPDYELQNATPIELSENNSTKVIFAGKDQNGNLLHGYEKSRETKMNIITREDWKARKSKKEFQSFHRPAMFIFVTQTNLKCPIAFNCSQLLLTIQRVLMDCYGDVFSNFYVDDEGRIYEGLGWRRMRSQDSIYIHFLTDGWKLPSSETFASFALLLWEGIRINSISEEFELVENKHLTKSFQTELLKWVQWSKRM